MMGGLLVFKCYIRGGMQLGPPPSGCTKDLRDATGVALIDAAMARRTRNSAPCVLTQMGSITSEQNMFQDFIRWVNPI